MCVCETQVGFTLIMWSHKVHFCCQEYETKSGRAGPGNPTSPGQSVRKNLDFEPLSTTALILEDRPAYVNTHTYRFWLLDYPTVFIHNLPVENAFYTMGLCLHVSLIPSISVLSLFITPHSQLFQLLLYNTNSKRGGLLKVSSWPLFYLGILHFFQSTDCSASSTLCCKICLLGNITNEN